MNDIDLLEQQAIDAAINLNWPTAVDLNTKILAKQEYNLGAILRLGFAYLQKNDLPRAKKTYLKALKIQSENNIALENIERIKILEVRGNKSTMKRDKKFDPNLFLEVPGKTKASTLVNLGQKSVLAQLTIGEEVFLISKKRKTEIRNSNKEYIGSLPDDLSKRVYLFIKGDSVYTCFIKEVSLNKVVVFIREESKGKKVQRFSSFPKNIQTNMAKVGSTDEEPAKPGEDAHEEEVEGLSDNELERLAESLNHEEKEFYTPFERDEDDEENLEE